MIDRRKFLLGSSAAVAASALPGIDPYAEIARQCQITCVAYHQGIRYWVVGSAPQTVQWIAMQDPARYLAMPYGKPPRP